MESLRIAFAVISLTLTVNAQLPAPKTSTSTDRDRGIQLIEQGNYAEAVTILRVAIEKDNRDIIAWHWLGVSFEKQGKPSDARKAHEKAAKLGDAVLMQSVSSMTSDELLVALSKLEMELVLASHSAYAYARLNPKLSISESYEWNERIEFLHDCVELVQFKGSPTYKHKDVTTQVRILAKPEPAYTELARQHKVTGRIVLMALFAENGQVRLITPITRLSFGLTLQAIQAARKIRFTPATKDGRPVSMWIQLEYNFDLY